MRVVRLPWRISLIMPVFASKQSYRGNPNLERDVKIEAFHSVFLVHFGSLRRVPFGVILEMIRRHLPKLEAG